MNVSVRDVKPADRCGLGGVRVRVRVRVRVKPGVRVIVGVRGRVEGNGARTVYGEHAVGVGG